MEQKLISKFKTLETNDATCAHVSKRNFMSIGIQKTSEKSYRAEVK